MADPDIPTGATDAAAGLVAAGLTVAYDDVDVVHESALHLPIGFVGLVAPHAARALVGQRHGRVLPVAALLGSLLVVVADTVGRTVIAPAQIPVGVVTAVIGAPYFAWLLWRSKGDR